MCGRLVVTSSTRELMKAVGASRAAEDRGPRYNLAPTQDVPAVLNLERDVLQWVRWGLVPAWAKDPSIGARMFNARIETMFEKPAFREPARLRRCVILANGFYEWQKTESGGKQPWFFSPRHGGPLRIAGLWDSWHDSASGAPLLTCTLLTTTAIEPIRALHDRMPVFLDDLALERWLSPDPLARDAAKQITEASTMPVLEAYPVSTLVNSTQNDSPDLLRPLSENAEHNRQLELF